MDWFDLHTSQDELGQLSREIFGDVKSIGLHSLLRCWARRFLRRIFSSAPDGEADELDASAVDRVAVVEAVTLGGSGTSGLASSKTSCNQAGSGASVWCGAAG